MTQDKRSDDTAITGDPTTGIDESSAATVSDEPFHKAESNLVNDEREPAVGDTGDTSKPEAIDRSPEVTAGRGKSGRGLAWLGLLVGLMAVVASAYLYYVLIYLRPGAELQVGLERVQTQTRTAAERLQQQVGESLQANEQRITQVLESQADQLRVTKEQFAQTLQEALHAAPPSSASWKIAEAEYLLRIANHRVLMEQDSQGALTLLLGAEQILAELDDFSLHTVRARLADEILALKQVPADNLQDIYIRLAALRSETAALRSKVPEYQAKATEQDSALTVWEQIVDATQNIVRIRNLDDEAIQPLKLPVETAYLHQHIQLSLAQAQLGVLKRHQQVYIYALGTARAYLVEYMEMEGNEKLLEELDVLSGLSIDRPLPSISGSLNELLKISGVEE